MQGTCIVLNGATSSGKTTIASVLQARWQGRTPLQVSGLDTFLSCQPRGFYGFDGEVGPGLTWRAATVDGGPAFVVDTGQLGLALVRAAQAFWRACAEEGIDQVVDDVWMSRDQALSFKRTMSGLEVLWVGVRCDLEDLEAREVARGDRSIGQARGQFATVHSFTDYDIEVDTSRQSPEECAEAILAHLGRARGTR